MWERHPAANLTRWGVCIAVRCSTYRSFKEESVRNPKVESLTETVGGLMNSTYKSLFIAAIITVLFLMVSSYAFSETCIMADESFYHKIMDRDIIEIGNSKYWALVRVTCEEVERKNAFSSCPDCTTFSNKIVKIDRSKKKVCEGDTIKINNDSCKLGNIKKDKW
jgi:hypothetical protein